MASVAALITVSPLPGHLHQTELTAVPHPPLPFTQADPSSSPGSSMSAESSVVLLPHAHGHTHVPLNALLTQPLSKWQP